MTKEKRNQYQKEYRKTHKNIISMQRKCTYKENRQKICLQAKKSYGKIIRDENRCKKLREKKKLYFTQYYKENKDKILSISKTYRINNKDKLQKQKTSSGKTAYYARLKEKAIKQATPRWLTQEDKIKIKNIYNDCRRLESLTGFKFHVDHIYPISGKYSSGLHVPWNLRIIKAEMNLKKNNKELTIEEIEKIVKEEVAV